jgi:hypothetical protein
MVMNLHSCKVAALNATHLGALTRTSKEKELDLYCESFRLRPNWDILPGSNELLLSCLAHTILFVFMLDKHKL